MRQFERLSPHIIFLVNNQLCFNDQKMDLMEPD